MWAIARSELKYIVKPDASGANRLMLPGRRGFDFGNYRSGHAGAFARIMDSAREFGDYRSATWILDEAKARHPTQVASTACRDRIATEAYRRKCNEAKELDQSR